MVVKLISGLRKNTVEELVMVFEPTFERILDSQLKVLPKGVIDTDVEKLTVNERQLSWAVVEM
jgi:hypothetical protein